MKYILIIICLLGLRIPVYGQTNKGDLGKYEEAYNYLQKDSTINNHSFLVSDTLVFMERSLFWKFFQQEGESAIACLERIENIDQQEQYSKIYSEELVDKFGPIDDQANLFFSKISENILFAEYFYRYGINKGRVVPSDRFNAGYRYLFVFDKKDQLQDVLRQDIGYK